MGIIYMLLDGVGLTDTPAPPWTSADLRTIPALLGALPSAQLHVMSDDLLWKPLDATMGVPGLPQSGSGHTALLTGVNASALLGYHQAAFPAATLQRVIEEHSILRRARQLGLRALLATAYPERYWELISSRRLRATAGALAARAAGIDLLSIPEWLAGQALPWDITGEYLQRRRPELAGLPPLTPEEAGRRLAALPRQYELVFYECYLPDFVGHRRIDISHEAALALIDRFLGSLIESRHSGDTLVVVSDHGNIEEPGHRQHTRNPVPLCVVGPGARLFVDLQGIEDVAGMVLRLLGAQNAGQVA
ncbi:MAG: metalloenzyme [Herpetosiphonaceae bacterium]|nr:MAG: metalloenzyme [Herpetosiphonaceae bacterium]